MATAPLIKSEIKIIEVVEADLGALEKLFDEECAEWLELLKWDYKGPSMLIRDVARQRQLCGFVAMYGDVAVGFAYYLIEGSRCSIGDIYVSSGWRGLGIDREMAVAIFNKLDRIPRVKRIESQCVGVGNDDADRLFQERGFERLERYYMQVDVESLEANNLTEGPPGIFIRPWQEDDFAQAARVIHRSYRGTYDRLVNSQYRSEGGCAELLTILTDHIWCGDFLAQVSQIASLHSGTIAGVLIASRVASGVGHISQISVHPAQQGRGIGRLMIQRALGEFNRHGFQTASLAVTSANTNAMHLYHSCGFRPLHVFPVFYFEKKQSPFFSDSKR
jgi:ribosomal protein S18 acetylase RimI-like enzyme